MPNERVLIVDDDAANLKVARFALESEGFQISTACDAEEALKRVRDVRPRLILMDIRLPGMDGLELTRLLKTDPGTQGIAIVAVTAYAMMGDREKALGAGCDGYITKPLDPIQLPAQVSDLLARAGPMPAAPSPSAASTQETAPPSVDSSPETPPIEEAPDGSKQIVLIVEDNPATCKMYRVALESSGYAVVEARSGESALNAIRQFKPALIVQDLVLPDMDGTELAIKIREELGDAPVPIICVSGFLSPIDEGYALRCGFTQVLQKPVDPFHLMVAVKIHLDSLFPETKVGDGRLLVVAEDDPLQRKLADVWFSSAGFKVMLAANGAEALEIARRESPAAVISDVLMPSTDGFTLCLEIRNDPRMAGIPVILTSSAYSEKADFDLARRVGASALLPKEGGLEKLTRVLLDALRAPPQNGLTEPVHALEEEHGRRKSFQLDRQVMENASLLRRSMLHQAQLAVLAGAADALTKNTLVDAVLGDVLAACLDMAGVSKGALYVKKGDHALELRHQIGFTEAETLRLRTKFDRPDLFAEVASQGKVIAIPSNAVTSDLAQRLVIDAGVTSLLLVPVTAGLDTQGTMLLGARVADLSDRNATAFASVLGAQMGQALGLVQAFEKLAASELRYRTLTEHANDVICILTPGGTIREVNRRLTEITGYPAELFIGRQLQDFAVPKHPAAGREEEAEPQCESFESARRHHILKSDGGVALVDFSDARIEFDNETLVFSIGRDVTDQVRAQAQLMVSDRMVSLGTLAAGLAHEINNPLAVLLGNLEVVAHEAKRLVSQANAPENGTLLFESLQDAVDAGERVRQIVKDLRIFSRSDDADAPDGGPVDLNRVLESTLRMAFNEIRHRARIVKSYGSGLLVDANESRLGQVFLNLIMNAAQAIEIGHADVNEIRVITTGELSGRVAVEITDTGPGIPPELFKRLFTPFFSTKTAGLGTGLGLSICKQIVNELGGEITVASEVGRGTTFKVFLPQSRKAKTGKADEPAKLAAVRRGRILVVDDDPAMGVLLHRMLSTDHDVSVLVSAQDALNRIDDGDRFDVIFCDVMMPVVTGPDFYERLNRALPDQAARVVFLTGGVFTADAREFLSRVPNYRMEKPIKGPRLRQLVNERVR